MVAFEIIAVNRGIIGVNKKGDYQW